MPDGTQHYIQDSFLLSDTNDPQSVKFTLPHLNTKELVNDHSDLLSEIKRLIPSKLNKKTIEELRKYREVAERHWQYLFLENETISQASTLESLQKSIARLIVEGKLESTFEDLAQSNSGLDKTQTVFDCEIENPTTFTDSWFKEFTNLYSKGLKVYEESLSLHEQAGLELAQQIPQKEILATIASSQLLKYGVPDSSQADLLTQILDNTAFSEPFNFERSRSGYFSSSNGTASKVARGSTFLRLQKSAYCDPQRLKIDIATTEHEIIHLLENLGIINADIFVPIASAQTILTLEKLVVDTDRKESLSSNILHRVTQDQENLIKDTNASALNPFEFYIRHQKLANPGIVKAENMQDLVNQLTRLYGKTEPPISYRMGAFLARSLLIREKDIGPGYSQAYLAALAHTINPALAELCGQLVSKKNLTIEECLAKIEKPPFATLSENTSYKRIEEYISKI